MKGTWVKVRNYDKFKGRADIKQKTWFRCSNDLLEDEDFFEFEPAEILVWIYILSQSSKKQCDEIFINFERAERFARLKKKDVISAIEKLLVNQLLPVCRTDDERITYGSRTDDERDQSGLPPATNEQNEQDEQSVHREPDGSLPRFAEVWNQETKTPPRVVRWNKARSHLGAKILKDFGEEKWREGCRKVEASEFLVKKWGKVGIDWLLNPGNLTKVLEGNYDDGSSKATGGYDV